MLWMRRPRYLAWGTALLLVTLAVVADLRGPPQQRYPFAAADLQPGASLDPDLLDWRALPVGALPEVEVDGAVVRRPVARGEPLTPSSVSGGAAVPPGWWAVPVPLPEAAVPGDAVRLVALDPAVAVEGVVLRAATTDAFSGRTAGLVAVPGEVADRVAAAALSDSIVAMVAPTGS